MSPVIVHTSRGRRCLPRQSGEARSCASTHGPTRASNSWMAAVRNLRAAWRSTWASRPSGILSKSSFENEPSQRACPVLASAERLVASRTWVSFSSSSTPSASIGPPVCIMQEQKLRRRHWRAATVRQTTCQPRIEVGDSRSLRIPGHTRRRARCASGDRVGAWHCKLHCSPQRDRAWFVNPIESTQPTMWDRCWDGSPSSHQTYHTISCRDDYNIIWQAVYHGTLGRGSATCHTCNSTQRQGYPRSISYAHGDADTPIELYLLLSLSI